MDPIISAVSLRAPGGAMAAMEAFYTGVLGLARVGNGSPLAFTIGSGRLEFIPNDERAFYHFALLVPGNRFDAAHEWIGGRTTVLPGPDGEVFDFTFWDAQACYFHDPAGSIVELIAHRGVGEAPETGPFSPAELIGISEIGLVVADPARAADALRGELGLELWSGEVEGATSLGFVGRKAHTLILSRPGRGWLPTGRPAQIHAAEVTVTGTRSGDLRLDPHRVRVQQR
ncbi:MAG TPA: hypothetical protein VHC49_11295 [Mycobacteriales bacterium]|nr:hypothetical protein [Mycobacteriales bacterium]